MDKDTDTTTPNSTDELDVNDYTSPRPPVTSTSELRQSDARNIVKNNVIASMASGLVPIPLLDIIGVTNIQFHMIQVLSEHYEAPSETISKTLITSLVSGALPVASVLGVCSVLKSMPGIGTLIGSGSVSVMSGAVTYAVGQVFIRHFEQGGTVDDFNPDSAKTYFNEELESGKQVVRDLMRELKEPVDSTPET